jgi:hypothetical protein
MARAASRRLLRELPTEEEMTSIISDLRSQNPHALVVLSVAYLENALERVMRVNLAPLSKQDERRLFDGSANGILGTFSSKIRVAYAFRLLGPISYNDLMLINEIRNVFSHTLHNLDFSNPLIEADCRKLKSYIEFFTKKTGTSVSGYAEPITIFSETVHLLYIGFLAQLISAYSIRFEDYSLDEMLRRAERLAIAR